MWLSFFIVFIVISAGVDAIVIEVFKISISKWGHRWRWVIRAVVACVLVYFDDQWVEYGVWQLLPTYAIAFWFLFDTALNWLRGKELTHLGDSFLDKLQKENPGEFPWFVFKAIVFIGLVGAYYFNSL